MSQTDDQTDEVIRRFDLEKVPLGIAAVSGLFIVAIVSGLPSVTCVAMGETYVLALRNLGIPGLFGMVVYLNALMVGTPASPLWRGLWNLYYLIIVCVLGGWLCIALIVAVNNVDISVQQCLKNERTANSDPAREETRLITMDDFFNLFKQLF